MKEYDGCNEKRRKSTLSLFFLFFCAINITINVLIPVLMRFLWFVPAHQEKMGIKSKTIVTGVCYNIYKGRHFEQSLCQS